MIEWLIIGAVFVAALFLGYLWIDEERELRRIYRMFGTTGFADVDARLRQHKDQD